MHQRASLTSDFRRVGVAAGDVVVRARQRRAGGIDTADMEHRSWPSDMFTQIVDGYLASTGHRGDRVGNGQSYLMDAPGLLAHAVSVMITRAESQT